MNGRKERWIGRNETPPMRRARWWWRDHHLFSVKKNAVFFANITDCEDVEKKACRRCSTKNYVFLYFVPPSEGRAKNEVFFTVIFKKFRTEIK